MTRLLMRVGLSALAFLFVLPMINGIAFHGNWVEAIGLGAFFAIMSWVVTRVAAWLTAILAVGTLGLALLILVPLWIFGQWLLPAVVLMLVADIMPAYLSIAGWLPAILGGLVMFFIGIVTAEPRRTVVVRTRDGSGR